MALSLLLGAALLVAIWLVFEAVRLVRRRPKSPYKEPEPLDPTVTGASALSPIEVASAAVIIWQFSGLDEKRERLALRLIGVSFFLLAAYVGGRAVLDLLTAAEPESSPIGIALASASLVVMPVLAAGKARIGRRLGSSTVSADSRQTWLCTYLSAVLLAGLLLNSLWGWWWADPLAGLVIAGLALREGLEAWNGDSCCD